MIRRVVLVLPIVLAAPLTAAEPSIERLKRDLTYLASEECEGRGAQTQGLHKAADYIAKEFEKIGLKPAGTNGYFQPFKMSTGAASLQSATLKLRGPLGQEIELKINQHYQAVGLSGTGTVTAPVVFAGYGVDAAGYNDYNGLDVAGKVVIVMRKTPYPGSTHTPF